MRRVFSFRAFSPPILDVSGYQANDGDNKQLQLQETKQITTAIIINENI